MGRTDPPNLHAAARRVRGAIEHLAREGTILAQSDVTLHEIFPVAVSAAESEALFLRNLDWELEEVSGWDDLRRWAVLRTSTNLDT